MPFVIGRGFAEVQILQCPHQTVCEEFVPGQFVKNAHNYLNHRDVRMLSVLQ